MAEANIADRTNESDKIPRITRSNQGKPIDLADSASDEPRRRRHGDLTGRTFGFWFVKGMAPYGLTSAGDKVKMWDCRCRCGYRRRLRTNTLTSGRSQSCGCYALDMRRDREDADLDLTGETFDRWFVLRRAEDRVSRAGVAVRQWLCRCSCGTEKPVLASSLRQGKSRSCGCLRKEVLPEARRLARLRRQVAAVDAAF